MRVKPECRLRAYSKNFCRAKVTESDSRLWLHFNLANARLNLELKRELKKFDYLSSICYNAIMIELDKKIQNLKNQILLLEDCL